MVRLFTSYHQSGSCAVGYLNQLYAVQFSFGKIFKNNGLVGVSVFIFGAKNLTEPDLKALRYLSKISSSKEK
jgi:hypothetical protein